MRNSQLLQLLSYFTKNEWREFQKWIRSPYFNQREDVCRLSLYIEAHLSHKPEELRKEKTWTGLYPGKKYDDKQLNYLMSWLLQQVRQFLAYREWQQDEANTLFYLSKALRKKSVAESFEKTTTTALEILQNQSYRDESFYQLTYQLHLEKYEYQQLQSRKGDIPLQVLFGHSQTAYRYSQLKLQCYREMLTSIKPEVKTPEDHPEAPPVKGIELYEAMLQALQDPAAEDFFYHAKILLKECEGLLRAGELRQLYLMALNYCIRKINSGKSDFMREAFDLYRAGLESRMLFENGVLSRFTYHNAVTAGLYQFEFDWVREFIESYKAFLPARDRHQAYQFNLATYYFRLPDYDAAMELLRNADFDFDSLANLNARSMLLRIYYEKGYQDTLLSLLDSFQAYIRRHPDIGYQQENYSNLLRFVRRMVREPALNEAEKAVLRQEVLDTRALAERRWLLGQLGSGNA